MSVATRALARLGLIEGPGKIPFVRGMEVADCGAASMAMVLGYFGRHESLSAMHTKMQPGRDGVTARTISDTASAFGLVPRALSVREQAWRDLPRASILHWKFNHFVVFDKFERNGVALYDPMFGRRVVDIDEFRKSFTGVALTFTPGERFEKREGEKSKTWDMLGVILKERALLTRVVLTSLVLQLIGLVFPTLTSLIVDEVLPRGDGVLLSVVALGIALIFVAEGISELVRSYMLANLKAVVDARLSMKFFDHLLALPYAFFQRHTDGDLLMRLSSNATIREALTGSALSAVLDGLLVSGYLLILFIASPTIGAVMILMTVMAVLPFALTHTRRQEIIASYIEARTKAESLQVEVVRAIETVKAMGLEQETLERWSNLFVDTLNVELQKDRVWGLLHMVEAAIRGATPIIVLLIGAKMALSGGMHAGQMLALSTLAGLYMQRVATLVESARSLQNLRSYIERIVDVMDSPVEAPGARVQVQEVRGAISAQGLSFRYDAQAALVLDTISIEVKPGEAVAFVGGSGSGKSTLIKLLGGLYLPSLGEVRLDGVSLAELDLNHYRKRISVVTQETHLFAGSIRQNIALSARDVGMGEIMAAARLACIHDDITAMPMGYETVLTDQGRSLSGGQRQRLALARALVRKPRILLLDEATSAIDPVTEQRIKRNLDALNCTRLVVAHRLGTVRDADRIFVLAHGRVVETGTHDELMAKNEAYARLALAQDEPPR